MKATDLLQKSLFELLSARPYLRDFFAALDIHVPQKDISLVEFLKAQPIEQLAEFVLDHDALIEQCMDFILRMEGFEEETATAVQRITVIAGMDKSGMPEAMGLELTAGDVVSVVGPTGSGKSRLLADIECLAQGDTPSGRRVLLDGEPPDDSLRFSGEHRIVAQLSQNMNFVMDLTVQEFIGMHAESRLINDVTGRIHEIFNAAVGLAGEPFTLDTQVTALSGGQSRALMIADVACLSSSPIVLIDEIENAGVDRQQALALLVKREKIVILATHDPLLALSGNRRAIIKNGGIIAVMETGPEERAGLKQLSALDRSLSGLRNDLRQGKRVIFDLKGITYP